MKISIRSSAIVTVLAIFGCVSSASAQTGGGNTGGGNTGGTATGGTGTPTMRSPGATTTTTTSASTATTSTMGAVVERRFADVGSTTTTRGASRTGGLGGFGGGGFGGLSPFGLNPFGTGAGASDAKANIRTRLRSEVVLPSRPAGLTQTLSQQRVSRSYIQPRFRRVGVQMTDSVAVLSGTVASEADRRMAELMLRLEPGVASIDNQIIVSP